MKNSLIVPRNESQVIGVLSGWDRVVLFSGCCPLFAFVDGMLQWLLQIGIWPTDYSKRALAISDALKKARLAEPLGNRAPALAGQPEEIELNSGHVDEANRRYLEWKPYRLDEQANAIPAAGGSSDGLGCDVDGVVGRGDRQDRGDLFDGPLVGAAAEGLPRRHAETLAPDPAAAPPTVSPADLGADPLCRLRIGLRD